MFERNRGTRSMYNNYVNQLVIKHLYGALCSTMVCRKCPIFFKDVIYGGQKDVEKWDFNRSDIQGHVSFDKL